MKLYGAYTAFENAAYLLRPVEEGDAADLLEVYGDKNALPFFNSDNCDGDNFYYPTLERVAEDRRIFIGNLAHEMKTPLTTAPLATETIKEVVGCNRAWK